MDVSYFLRDDFTELTLGLENGLVGSSFVLDFCPII